MSDNILWMDAKVEDQVAGARDTREEKGLSAGLRRKAATLASVLALIALMVGSLFGDRGLLYLIDPDGPWRDVFVYKDVPGLRRQFFDTGAHALGNFQAQVRFAGVGKDSVPRALEAGDRVELHYVVGVVTHITKAAG